MKKIVCMIILLILPVLSNAETDKQAALKELIQHRDNIIYEQSSNCRDLSNMAFLIQSLKDAGYSYSWTIKNLKDPSDEVKSMAKGVYSNNYDTNNLIKYSDKIYQRCIENSKKEVALP